MSEAGLLRGVVSTFYTYTGTYTQFVTESVWSRKYWNSLCYQGVALVAILLNCFTSTRSFLVVEVSVACIESILMMSSVNDWDNEYARLARIASQLRSGSSTASPVDLQHHLTRLESQLSFLGLSPAEFQRRRRLVQHLQMNTNSSGGLYSVPTSSLQQTSSMHMALRQQDDLIDELAVGVGRLRDQTLLIGDEARMHINVLGDMEQNLDIAQDGLEAETRRAARLRQDQSVWRLQLTVAGLSVLLVLLILVGLN